MIIDGRDVFGINDIETVNLLVREGFDLIDVIKDKKKKGEKSYLFLYTMDFYDTLQEINSKENNDRDRQYYKKRGHVK